MTYFTHSNLVQTNGETKRDNKQTMNHTFDTIIDVEKWSPADLPSCSESCFGETFSGNRLCKIKLPEGTNPSMYFIGASDKFVVKDKKGILWLHTSR